MPETPDVAPEDHLLAVARSARDYILELKLQLREAETRIAYLEQKLQEQANG